MRIFVRMGCHSDLTQHFSCALVGLILGLIREAVRYIFRDCQVRKQRIVLK